GSSQRLIIPRLEAASGRKAGEDLFYCYNPAFIALGEVVKGFERPDYVLIGEHDRHAGDEVLEIHRSMTPVDTPVARMQPVEAEICKLASNTHETMRVSFANMLFSACTEVPGANVDRITEALAHRMGKRFFKGAVPYGGPCWPRDNEALAAFMGVMGVPNGMPRAVDVFNREHARYVHRKVLALTRPGDVVGLLGLAYKPGTNVIERSFAVDLAAWLTQERRSVLGWDPLAMENVRRELGESIGYASSAEECLRRSRVAVVLNPLQELNLVDWRAAREVTVVDCWRCLPAAAREQVGQYLPLGQGAPAMLEEWNARHGGPLDLLST
ncbi:MAG TPA: UDP binding domain-containing protein, partial [bacterium]|nr:UDP binding domain-containing protein [bacterium]